MGKTTLARLFTENHSVTFFDLESRPDQRRVQNPELGLGGLQGLVVLDEIQQMPELFSTLREETDLPLHFHTHDTSGISAASVLAAAHVFNGETFATRRRSASDPGALNARSAATVLAATCALSFAHAEVRERATPGETFSRYEWPDGSGWLVRWSGARAQCWPTSRPAVSTPRLAPSLSRRS